MDAKRNDKRRRTRRVALDLRSLSGREELWRFPSAKKRDPAVAAWFTEGPIELRTIAREWFDAKKFDAVADGASSAAALAVQEIARERKKVFLISGAGSSDFTGKACSPTGFQFAYDTYGLSNSTTRAMVQQGYKNWFMLTADYAFGLALEKDASNFLQKNGGTIVNG